MRIPRPAGLTRQTTALRRVVYVFVILIGVLPVADVQPAARGQSMSCDDVYPQAERAYLRADFSEALSLLDTCTDGRPKGAVRLTVYRLQAFAHLGSGQDGAARRVAEDLLDVYPAYAPNPAEDRPDYVDLIDDVRSSREPLPDRNRATEDRRWVRWVVASAAAIATTVVVAVLVRNGGDDDGGRPEPPDDDDDDDVDDDFD